MPDVWEKGNEMSEVCSTCSGTEIVPATGRGLDGYDRCPDCAHDADESVFALRRLDGARWCVKHEGFVDVDQDECDVARMDRLVDCEVWPLYVHRAEHAPVLRVVQ